MTSARAMRLGIALRQLRETRNISLAQAASELRVNQSTISRYENAKSMPTPATVRGLLLAYGITDREQLDAWADLALRADGHGPWLLPSLPQGLLDYAGLEMDAQRIRTYGGMLIPGLLQTPAYMTAVMTSGPRWLTGAEIRERIEIRQLRQGRLTDSHPLALHAIIDEHSIRRPIDVGVMKEQCEHLDALLARPGLDLTVQVLPLSSGLHVGHSPLNLLEYTDTGLSITTVDTAVGEIVLHDPDDVRKATKVWHALESRCLDPAESRVTLHSADDQEG